MTWSGTSYCLNHVCLLTSVKGPRHSLALSVRYVKLLVGNQKLGSNILTGMDLLLRVSALASERETILEYNKIVS
jgi:hypothetical protein